MSIGERGPETEAIGRRMGATLADGVVVFAVLYGGIMLVGGTDIARAAGLAPAVVLGFLLWFFFSVLGFAPLLVMHGYSAVWYLVAVGLWAVYGAAFEAAWGTTPGKRLFGLAVYEDGGPPSIRAAVVRNVLRYVDALGFYLLGFFVLALTDRRRRIGDLLAGTTVSAADDGTKA